MRNKTKILIFVIAFISLLTPQRINASHILLYENFDDGDTQDGQPVIWNEINSNQGFWSITPTGQYRGFTPNTSNASISTLAGETNWDDYIFEVDVTGIQGLDRHIQFRLDLSRPPGKKGYAVKYLEGSHIELQRAGTGIVDINHNFKSSLGETHRLKVVALGPNIEVYEGNNLLLQYTDLNPDAYLTGQIGMFTERGAFTNETLYDNLIVTHISKNIGILDLPFDYPGRGMDDQESFINTFNSRVSSVFDHDPEQFKITNFKGENYDFNDCFKKNFNNHNFDCYDAHNGYDFRPSIHSANETVLPALSGKVVYATPDCKNNLSGYGCYVVLEHLFEDDTFYTLYGHLSEVSAILGENISETDEIGKMGKTGMSTGVHLHFSVMKPVITNNIGLNAFTTMDSTSWESLIEKSMNSHKPEILLKPRASNCNYTVENNSFKFVDPSGFESNQQDPWNSFCNTENEYMWKYELNN